jgi:hypothetical protein
MEGSPCEQAGLAAPYSPLGRSGFLRRKVRVHHTPRHPWAATDLPAHRSVPRGRGVAGGSDTCPVNLTAIPTPLLCPLRNGRWVPCDVVATQMSPRLDAPGRAVSFCKC